MLRDRASGKGEVVAREAIERRATSVVNIMIFGLWFIIRFAVVVVINDLSSVGISQLGKREMAGLHGFLYTFPADPELCCMSK